MGKFRTNVLVFLISLVGVMMMFELAGVMDLFEFSWWDMVAMIPAEIAVPIGFVVGAMWIIDP